MVDQDFKARQEDIGKLLFCITFHIVKLFKMNSKDFELESKNPIYTDLDRLHYRTKVDPYSHWNYIENYHSSYKHAKM